MIGRFTRATGYFEARRPARCDAVKRYALQCKHDATTVINGRPLCTFHANRLAKGFRL